MPFGGAVKVRGYQGEAAALGGTHLVQQFLVRAERRVLDGDAGLLLEAVEERLRHVVRPVHDQQLAGGGERLAADDGGRHGDDRAAGRRLLQQGAAREAAQARKSVGKGKSVSVRVDIGGRRIIKKKNKK